MLRTKPEVSFSGSFLLRPIGVFHSLIYLIPHKALYVRIIRYFLKCLISCLTNFFSLWWWAQFNSSTAPLVGADREALLGHWIFVLNTSCRTATLCVVAIWSLWLAPQKGNIFNLNCSLDIKLQKFDPHVQDGRPKGWIVFLAFPWHTLTRKNSQLFTWCTARHILYT